MERLRYLCLCLALAGCGGEEEGVSGAGPASQTGPVQVRVGGAWADRAPGAVTPGEGTEIRVRGRIETGIMAIGGETTGYRIRFDGTSWELDPGDDENLRTRIESLDGKEALVEGILTQRQGVEVPTRTIVRATTAARAP